VWTGTRQLGEGEREPELYNQEKDRGYRNYTTRRRIEGTGTIQLREG